MKYVRMRQDGNDILVGDVDAKQRELDCSTDVAVNRILPPLHPVHLTLEESRGIGEEWKYEDLGQEGSESGAAEAEHGGW